VSNKKKLIIFKYKYQKGINKMTTISNFNIHCFSCNSPIYKGDEMTRCIEPGRLRSKQGRWVHSLCVPSGIKTEYYMEVLDDMKETYPDTENDEIEFMVYDHDYWIHQKKEKEEEKPNLIFEKAKTGRSLCVICNNFIKKGDMRVGKLNKEFGNYGNFKHQDCWDQEDPILPDNLIKDLNLELEEKVFNKVVDDTLRMLRRSSRLAK